MRTPPRTPSVAGQFYPSSREDLLKIIESSFLHTLGPGKKPPRYGNAPLGIVTPHAGLMYSGPIAAHSYYAISSMREFDRIILIGPNHYGIGEEVAVPWTGRWVTPLGDVEIDTEAAAEISKLPFIKQSDLSHRDEHSIEVQLPFLQYLYGDEIKLLPISMLRQDKATSLKLAQAIIRMKGKNILISSSDLTHYEPYQSAKLKDSKLIKSIEKLDVDQYYEIMRGDMITACGYGPIAAVMTACRMLGATKGNLLKYATSGDTGGNKDSVVGYASISFT